MVPQIKLIRSQKFFVKHTLIKSFAASVYVDSCLSLKMEILVVTPAFTNMIPSQSPMIVTQTLTYF